MQAPRSTTVREASDGIVVPRAAELESTLGSVTERLARELESPSECAPDWSDYEWAVARAVAAMHGISPLLAVCLPWRGPHAWTSFLQEQRSHTLARQQRIQAVLVSIGEKAREAGVAVTPLKGAALHELGLYIAGDRPMADIDLLVRPSDAERMTALLATLGFGLSGVTWKERIFTPIDETAAAQFGEHSDNSVKIELHERICEKLPWRLTDVSEFIFPAKPRPGLNRYPSNGGLMRHLLLHAAGSMAFQGLRILQLHDIALLAERMSEADWNEVAQSPRASRMWWAFPPLDLVSRYYKGRIPSHVLAAMKHDCSFFLRTIARRTSLIAVSYSHLWVKAFPGIEWSQSVFEMLRYAASRVRPGPDHMAHRARVAKTEAWARQSEWSRFSQSRRIVQWISARQTRPVTMNAIVAALSKRE
jgi:hypothetical protein